MKKRNGTPIAAITILIFYFFKYLPFLNLNEIDDKNYIFCGILFFIPLGFLIEGIKNAKEKTNFKFGLLISLLTAGSYFYFELRDLSAFGTLYLPIYLIAFVIGYFPMKFLSKIKIKRKEN